MVLDLVPNFAPQHHEKMVIFNAVLVLGARISDCKHSEHQDRN